MHPFYLKIGIVIVASIVIAVIAELRYRKKIKNGDKAFKAIMDALEKNYDKEIKNDKSNTKKD